MPHSPQAAIATVADAVSATVIEQAVPQALHQSAPRDGRAFVLHGMAEASLLSRVGRVIQDMNAGRAVTDAEVLQHEADCRRLSESTYDRFQATGNPADREEAVLWLARATEARKCLSPAFKQAREAQIQQEIAQGTGCYFLDMADAARARVGGRG